jgi:hypothetical protein
VTTIVLPESLPVPKCSSCNERPAAYLCLEVSGGAFHALCVRCDEPGPGKVKTARVGEFAVLVRAI